MTTILALDTATTILSAALVSGERKWYREIDAGLGHSELLMDLADSLLKGAGLGPGDLGAVACMKGPGSFTGLRIGFSAAKGIALARDIPLIACPTLDCLAYSWSPWPGLVVPVIDAKKERFFSALYRGGRRISAELDAGADVIGRMLCNSGEPVILTGPDAPLFLSRLREAGDGALRALAAGLCLDPLYRGGRARELAAVAKETAIVNNGKGDVLSGPEYLRKSDAER